MATRGAFVLLLVSLRLLLIRSFSMSPNNALPPAEPFPYKKTFYQRPLPDTCTAFTSRAGRALFASALRRGGLRCFFHLVQQHATQAEPAYCGVATLAVALNALARDPRRSWRGTPWRWYEESLLNCCVPLETVQKAGITIPTFACLARCQGLEVQVKYADSATVEDFRDAVQRVCQEDDAPAPVDTTADGNSDDPIDHLWHVLVASYDRGTLNQTGTGHFSPIGAYDAASDSVLVLDTARFKYGAHWVRLPLLFEAMRPVDPDTGRSRGFVVLTNPHGPDGPGESGSSGGGSPGLPVSLLLRSTMESASVRRTYKQYLANRRKRTPVLSWEEVLRYWSPTEDDPNPIWSMVKPNLCPTPDEVELANVISQVRTLIEELLPSIEKKELVPAQCCGCGPHDERTIDLRAEEAIYIVYLASIPEVDRDAVVRSKDLSASSDARDQLLAEAKLLEIAIENSDDEAVVNL